MSTSLESQNCNARARQGLHRVMSHYEKKKPAWEKSYGGYSRPGSTDPWANYRRTPSLAAVRT